MDEKINVIIEKLENYRNEIRDELASLEHLLEKKQRDGKYDVNLHLEIEFKRGLINGLITSIHVYKLDDKDQII